MGPNSLLPLHLVFINSIFFLGLSKTTRKFHRSSRVMVPLIINGTTTLAIQSDFDGKHVCADN